MKLQCVAVLSSALLIGSVSTTAFPAEPSVVHLWPAKPPGETKELPPEENITKPDDKPVGDRPIIKLANVSTPTLTVYRPAPDRNTRLAVIVCPGGGHRILAFDHEGTEVAEWLNTLGVTGIVLKYRVPARNPDKRWEAAVQDAQRAISFVRSQSKEWNIDPQKIGILGFSAGGDTACRAALLHADRQYTPIDAVDETHCRPDFAALIYPGGLDDKSTSWKLKDDVKVDSTTPPMFFAHAADDNVPASQSVLLFTELRKAKISAELHVYATGGHGYGMRQTGHPVNSWPQRCEDWLRHQGWLSAAALRLPRDNLLVFRDTNREPQRVKSIDDWQKRRAEILGGMRTVMGTLPGDEKRCPLDMQLVEETDCGSYVRRLITYASEPGSRVPAYLCIPKAALNGNTRVPAVLCLHGTNNEVGHGVVVGFGGSKRPYASELAERGYITFAPNYPLLAKYQPDLKALGWESGTLKAVWDNIRGLDLLETLPYVKPGPFGAIGHSLGGHNAVYTSVFDNRLQAVVSSCGLDSYLDYYGGDESKWLPEKGWCQTRYMLRLADYRGRLHDIPFDFHELVGALAPRHVLIVAPTRDHNFQAASVDRIAAAAKDVYRLYDQPQRLQVEHPDCEHEFPEELREKAYRLFDAVLR